MPNWVKNIINIKGPAEDITKAIDSIRDAEQPDRIDFGRLVPRPKRLNIVSGGYDRQYVALYLQTLSEEDKQTLQMKLSEKPVSFYHNYFKKYQESFDGTVDLSEDKLGWMRNRFKEDYRELSPETMAEVGKAYIDNILEYGHDTWYDWNIYNWGTKWNPCECNIGDDYLEFETAWSAPCPILETLSAKFPDLIFYYDWADENLGYNCGRCELKNGEVIAEEVFETDEDSYEFACTVWGYGPDDFEEE